MPSTVSTQPLWLTVYRGTKRGEELQLWAETDGYVLSEAARDGYYSYLAQGYDFGSAWIAGLKDSEVVLRLAVDSWGGAITYSQAHSEFGTELSRAFGPRPLVSWTTDLPTAQHFAGQDGYVFEAKVQIATILNPSWATSAEHEVLIPNGTWAQRRGG